MYKKYHKDVLALLILLGVIGLITGIVLFGRYASKEAQTMVAYGVVTIFALIMLFVLWKAIRLIID
jgi:predicted MFS family arabinose efflux permease